VRSLEGAQGVSKGGFTPSDVAFLLWGGCESSNRHPVEGLEAGNLWKHWAVNEM